MNLIISIWISAASALSPNALAGHETALEMTSFQIEYRSISKTGVLRANNCLRCTQKIYEFDNNVSIYRSGKKISLKAFLNEYWEIKYPTIFFKPNSKKVTRISYPEIEK